MRLLVTGATGVIGPAVVRALLQDGHTARVLVRPASDRARLAGLEVEFAPGDVTEPATLPSAVEGVEAVVHMAGLHDSWAPRRRDFFDVNVTGTANVHAAAQAAGVRRLLFVSSGAAIGERRGEVGTETTERARRPLSAYEASKLAAERRLRADGVPPEVVVVNPSSVYGPGDLAGNGQAIIGAVSGRLGVTTDVATGFVYIEDVARGIAAALARGRPGARYILSGQNISRLAFLRRAAELAGVDRQLRAAVPTLWWFFTSIYGFQAWLARRRPPISRDAVRIALHGFLLDGAKATRELGVTYTPLDDGLNATLDWLNEEGHVDLPGEEEDATDGDPAK